MNLRVQYSKSSSLALGFRSCFLGLLLSLCLHAAGQTAPNTSSSTNQQPYDTSTWLELLAAAEGGGGLVSSELSQPTVYAGAKVGVPVHFGKFNSAKPDYTFTLDLGYDRLQARSGFSTEVSAMLPVWRYPKPQVDESKNFLRIYGEPGVGYRAGQGPFGGYGSAKIMLSLFSDKRLDLNKASPFLEIQRRFPFDAPLHGDTRVALGLMIALCNHCGLD